MVAAESETFVTTQKKYFLMSTINKIMPVSIALGTCLEIKLPPKHQINILEEDGEMVVESDVGLEGVAEPDVKAM